MHARCLIQTTTRDVCPEQGLVNYIFRGVFTQGLDSQFFMVHKTKGAAVYPPWSAIYLQDAMRWTPGEKSARLSRNSVVLMQAQVQSLANGTDLTANDLEQFARKLEILVDCAADLPVNPPARSDRLQRPSMLISII
jgi:hypothetical protein